MPVMTSEHAFWTPWLVDQPRVGSQVDAALPGIHLVTTVSDFLRRDVDAISAGRAETAVLSNVVDDLVFTPAPRIRDPDELLYVGLIRKFKRVDVLLRAVAVARRTLPQLHLRYCRRTPIARTAPIAARCGTLISSLGLDEAVRVENGAAPAARRRGDAPLRLRRRVIHEARDILLGRGRSAGMRHAPRDHAMRRT